MDVYTQIAELIEKGITDSKSPYDIADKIMDMLSGEGLIDDWESDEISIDDDPETTDIPPWNGEFDGESEDDE